MSASEAGDMPAEGGDTVTGVIHEVHQLANDVGPAWGLAIVVAICLFFPRFGVLVSLAKLWKEDRADARQRNLETQRLQSRYENRAKLPKKGR